MYIFVDFPEAVPCLHLKNCSCWSTEAFHVLYNVKLYDKCEKELKDGGWDAYHLFHGQED